MLRLEAINRAVPLSLYGSAHGCRSASCSRIGLYFVCIEGRVLHGGILPDSCVPPATAPSHHLAISPLLPLTSPFTVKIHTNIFFIAQIGTGCQSSALTPGQPPRVAPTISPNGGTTKGLRPICTKRTPRDSDTWRRKLCSVRYAHEKRRAAGQTCAQRTLPQLTLSPLERSARETKRIMKRSERSTSPAHSN